MRRKFRNGVDPGALISALFLLIILSMAVAVQAGQKEQQPEDPMERIVSQLSQDCLQRCGIWDEDHLSCGENPGAIRRRGECTCDQERNYVLAARDPTHWALGVPRCVRPVAGVRLNVQTADFENASTEHGFVLSICPERPYTLPLSANPSADSLYSHEDCFRCKFDDSGDLYLNQGVYETIDVTADPDDNGCEILPGSRPLDSLRYPDDTNYFAIHPNHESWGLYNNGIMLNESPQGDCGFDGWLLAGIEFQIRFSRNILSSDSAFHTIYRDAAVNRFIDFGGDCDDGIDVLGSPNEFSPFSFKDTVVAVYTEIRDCEDCGTDDEIFVRIPLDSPLSRETEAWINNYTDHDTPWLRLSEDHVECVLNWGNYDDFERREKTSYGCTIPFGDSIRPEYQICTNGDDAMELHRIRAYYVQPTLNMFLESQMGWFDQAYPNVSLSTDGDEGVTCWPGEKSYRRLSGYQPLPTWNTIRWPSTIDLGRGTYRGAFGFGRR